MTLMRRVALAALISAASVTPSLPASTAIPEIIRDLHGAPAWVSATAAVDSSGQLRADLFGDRIDAARTNARLNAAAAEKQPLAAAIGAQSADAVGDCRIFVGPTPDHFQPSGSLNETVRSARTIVSGRVAEIVQGFYYGIPGSLIRLQSTVLKGASGGDTLLFFQLARIKTADGVICAKPLGEFTAPAPGHRMLVFSMTEPLPTAAGAIVWVDPARQLVHDSGGGRKPLVPASLRTDVTGYDAIERKVAAEVARANRVR